MESENQKPMKEKAKVMPEVCLETLDSDNEENIKALLDLNRPTERLSNRKPRFSNPKHYFNNRSFSQRQLLVFCDDLQNKSDHAYVKMKT